MAIATVADFLNALRETRLLEPAQLDECARLQAKFPEPRALAKELLQRGWLTPFQVNQLFKGQGQELNLGQYVVLERLGEGGMGAVFKARHRRLDRVDALKVIRKDRLANNAAVQRFHQEAKAVARLSHANIVNIYDADDAGATSFLAMEYVEGTDLAKLVKQKGPLPINQACDYIRQAAIGLQHAHERGLVHRDMKPHNLLLARNGAIVKILDMGLARMLKAAEEESDTAALTSEGAVMGSPDYISPEQVMNSHQADIRADIYSLGCTFYFLLTGQVPFPGGTLGGKLLQHRLEEPQRVEKLRPEVPTELGAVLRRMMAKRPADRYQTPADVGTALDPFTNLLVLEATVALDPSSAAPQALPLGDETAEALGLKKSTKRLKRPPLSKVAYRRLELLLATKRGKFAASAGALGFLLVVGLIGANRILVNNPGETKSPTQSTELAIPGGPPGRPLTYRSKDGRSEVRLPAGWSAVDLKTKQATVQAANATGDAFFLVITDSKTDFSARTYRAHAEATVKLLTLQEQQIMSGPSELVLNGRAAVQYQLNGTWPVIKQKGIVLYTVVDGRASFHRLAAWSLPSKFEANRPMLDAIIKSFVELQ